MCSVDYRVEEQKPELVRRYRRARMFLCTLLDLLTADISISLQEKDLPVGVTHSDSSFSGSELDRG